MISYAWRATAARISAGLLPAFVIRQVRKPILAQVSHPVPCAALKQLCGLVWPSERSQRPLRQLQGSW
jgi:hypothetical protein